MKIYETKKEILDLSGDTSFELGEGSLLALESKEGDYGIFSLFNYDRLIPVFWEDVQEIGDLDNSLPFFFCFSKRMMYIFQSVFISCPLCNSTFEREIEIRDLAQLVPSERAHYIGDLNWICHQCEGYKSWEDLPGDEQVKIIEMGAFNPDKRKLYWIDCPDGLATLGVPTAEDLIAKVERLNKPSSVSQSLLVADTSYWMKLAFRDRASQERGLLDDLYESERS